MNKTLIVGALALFFPGSVFSSAWAFDDKNKIQNILLKSKKVEVAEQQLHWALCELSPNYYVSCYDSYDFDES